MSPLLASQQRELMMGIVLPPALIADHVAQNYLTHLTTLPLES